MTLFDGTKPVCFAQARKGEVIVTQGYGKPPQVWRPSASAWKQSGSAAPATQPAMTISTEKTYYVARVDILNAGAELTLPPILTMDAPIPPTGYVGVTAEAITRIQQLQLNQIEVTEFGRHYSKPPVVYLSDRTADTTNDQSGGSGLRLRFTTYPALNTAQAGNDINAVNMSYLYAIQLQDGGKGYADGNSIDFSEGDAGYGKPPLIRICTVRREGGEPISVGAYCPVKSVGGVIVDIKVPDIYVCNNGNGLDPNGDPFTDRPADFAWGVATIQNTITWYQNRDIVTPGTPIHYGTAQAIMRATLRGKYQCYYRFVNKSVPENEGGPLYSNLSPVSVVDTNDGCASISWSIPSTIPSGYEVELWRTSSNQSTTLFKLKTLASGVTTFFDDLNDHELTNAKRKETSEWDEFAALPILLPNGELNANRFGVMDKTGDFAVAVMFQDRLWYGADTSNKRPNSLMFSETDEPESCPDINEIIIQQNLRSADYMTALIPYAGALIACQSRHCHRLTYVSQPLLDVATFLLAYRGCCNQRTWDIYEGIAYIMDDQGVYSLDPQGKLEPLTVGIDDLFQDQIDWSKRKWFIVRADRRLNVLRCSVSFKGDEGVYPTRQLCYSLDYKAWWVEVYPTNLIGSTDCRSQSGNVERIWGNTEGKIYRLGRGLLDDGVGAITSVTITNSGRGYKQPPKIVAYGGSCAEFQCSLNTDGQISGIQIRQCGTGYADGTLMIDPPEAGGEQAVATFTVSNGTLPVFYSFRSGNMEFTTDSQEPKAQTANNRQVSVVYQPTDESSVLNLETYYNGASYPRSNVVTRDRGTGFVHSEDVPAATLNMQKTSLQDSEAHGVARAIFSGRTLDDMSGTDRHIAVGLSGKQSDSGQVTLHVVDIYGVNEVS